MEEKTAQVQSKPIVEDRDYKMKRAIEGVIKYAEEGSVEDMMISYSAALRLGADKDDLKKHKVTGYRKGAIKAMDNATTYAEEGKVQDMDDALNRAQRYAQEIDPKDSEEPDKAGLSYRIKSLCGEVRPMGLHRGVESELEVALNLRKVSKLDLSENSLRRVMNYGEQLGKDLTDVVNEIRNYDIKKLP